MENKSFSNRLIHESSPYLLQHAHNPVDWYPWCEEALERARREDKPILVSIGYAACHWCHVMERESFEDPATAALMNEHFINIKIDREERPDLDHIYMDAVQAITGSGGWPLNVFLTPEAKPFYGGTYFPPQRAHHRSSWTEVLQGIHAAFTEKREEINAQAANLTEHLGNSNAFGFKSMPGHEHKAFADQETQDAIAEQLLQNADKVWGGFGNAPKFPQSFSIQFLLRHAHFTRHQEALEQALLSLDKMIYGGICDQLGGGFARYSTDKEWFAPHFEKMLYDNALLVSVLAEAYQLTGLERYAVSIRHTLAFIEREMMDESGGFYSALDADSEGVEGKFYTWTRSEIDEVLGADADLFCAYYQVTEKGNWEDTNILWIGTPAPTFAEKRSMSLQELQDFLEKAKKMLLSVRNKRIRPALDDKILLGWNALMNTAYSKAFAALGDDSYRQMAMSNMKFLESAMEAQNGSWFHGWKEGKAKQPAFLDDYAYLIEALIHLQEITGNGDYLLKAQSITELVIAHFSEPETGFFYYTHDHQQDVIIRKKEVYDGATPSGNAVMAKNLTYLSKVFDRPEWSERANHMMGALMETILKYPGSFGVWATLWQMNASGIKEIAVTGPRNTDQISLVMRKYLPNKIIQWGETKKGIFPLLKGREIDQKLTFYVCEDYKCAAPIYKITDFLAIV